MKITWPRLIAVIVFAIVMVAAAIRDDLDSSGPNITWRRIFYFSTYVVAAFLPIFLVVRKNWK
jgi:hypothetical protein